MIWYITKRICHRRALKLMGYNDILNSFVESYLQTLDIWDRNTAALHNLIFNVGDPIAVLETWLSYEENNNLLKIRNLLYRISADFAISLNLRIAHLVVYNYDVYDKTGTCIPLENDSAFSSLITLPSYEPDYADWRVPLIVNLAHEIGHAFVYQNWRSEFIFQSWQKAAKSIRLPDIVWNFVFNIWMNWFHELLADLIAALLLGPAGVYWDQKEYLAMREKMNQPFNVGSRSHPPDLLRTFWKVELLNGTNTPSSVISDLKTKVCNPFGKMILDFTEPGQVYVLSQSVINYFFSMAIKWLQHYGITYDWNAIENRCAVLNQGQIPRDRLGLTVSALLHNAMITQTTNLFDELNQLFGTPL